MCLVVQVFHCRNQSRAISHRLVKQLVEFYPDSNQVSLLNMGDADDITIWEYAKKTTFVS